VNPVCSRLARAAGLLLAAGVLWLALPAGPAAAIPVSPGSGSALSSTVPEAAHSALPHGLVQKPVGPRGPHGPSGVRSGQDVNVNLRGLTKKPSTSVTVILAMTLLSLLPAILLTCTSFTKVLVVLGLTRNALGLQQIPPNQVLAGLALFLSLFIMSPVLGAMNDTGLQPYLDGDKSASVAFEDGIAPLRHFMVKHTGDDELRLLADVSGRVLPTEPKEVAMTTLIPSFVLTELKQAFIIGFIIFIPFLVIDIVVSGALMALGMMMMPPVMVSLPFKLLLFVLVDGWGLVITSIVSSYH
jgi:flagellar biosynthetic protein FliP